MASTTFEGRLVGLENPRYCAARDAKVFGPEERDGQKQGAQRVLEC